MIEEKSVDTESFSDIFGKMRRKIAEIYPEWNDYNYHDPGITILELFAFLKENQNYYMNRTSQKIYNNFLRLAFELPDGAQQANLSIDLNTTQKINLNDKFYLEGITFESTECVTLLDNVIDYIMSGKNIHQSHFYVFGLSPSKRSQCEIYLTTELSANETYVLTADVLENSNRNTITKDFIPFAKMKLFYNDTELYFSDGTSCFLQSGQIKFVIEQDTMKAKNPCLRFELEECDYDIAPYVNSLSFSTIKLEQKDTLAYICPADELINMDLSDKLIDFYDFNGEFFEKSDKSDIVCIYQDNFYQNRILAVGNGFPNQSYDVKVEGFIKEASLLVENPINKGKFELYELVYDFEESTKYSHHFCIKENKFIFGNGINGRCPEGEIIISTISFTKGDEGNISKGNKLVYKDIITLTTSESYGGRNPKTVDDMFINYDDEIPTRLVTGVDFEKAVLKTTGLIIDDCKVLENNKYNETAIVVKPSGDRAILSQKYRENILKFLEPKKLLGNAIKLYSPTYINLEIFIDVVRSPLYLNAKSVIEAEIKSYFDSLKTFGAVTEYSVLYQRIDALDAVVKINSFNISARGEGVLRNRKGDVITLQNSVTMLASTDISINDML
ncbi:MAG: hypothetical protein R3Y09_08930 [Clostridia bacterium]